MIRHLQLQYAQRSLLLNYNKNIKQKTLRERDITRKTVKTLSGLGHVEFLAQYWGWGWGGGGGGGGGIYK